jgi:hypothetical protein
MFKLADLESCGNEKVKIAASSTAKREKGIKFIKPSGTSMRDANN